MESECKKAIENAQPIAMEESVLRPEVRAFHREAIAIATESKIPFLVGGGYGLMCYTGIVRMTKDLDLFVKPKDLTMMLDVYSSAGFHVELTDPRWLAKVYNGEDFVDIIFASMNGISNVDDKWFDGAVEREILGLKTQVCPVEEMIFTKAFVMDRERYDGADVAHLILACADDLDWDYLFDRFGACWRVLLSHLVLFSFIYPSEAKRIPKKLTRELMDRLRNELDEIPLGERVCRGTLFSGTQYLVDIEQWSFSDGTPSS